MSVVSNLKRMKWCTAELKMLSWEQLTPAQFTHSMLMCQLDETEQNMGPCKGECSREDIHSLNSISLWCMTLVVLALKTVLLPARILGDSVWNWVWAGTLCLTYLPADKAHRASSWKLMCSWFSAAHVVSEFSWKQCNIPFLVALPISHVQCQLIMADWKSHQKSISTTSQRDDPHGSRYGVDPSNDGLRNGDSFCPPWGLPGDRACFSISIGREHSYSSLASPCWWKCTSPFFIFFLFAQICWPAFPVYMNGGAWLCFLFQ